MNTLRASTFTGRDTEIPRPDPAQAEAPVAGPCRARIQGRGLLISKIPSSPDIMVDEATWAAFVSGQREQLVASIGRLYLTFARADLAPFLPVRVMVVPFRRSA